MRREIDLSLLVAVGMMILFGITMIYSAASGSTVWRSQALYAIVALAIALGVIYVPDKLFYDLAYPLYLFGLLALVAVLVWGIGTPARWLPLSPSGSVRLQPSEFAKIATIMALARFLGDQSAEAVSRPRAVATALLLALVPMALVARQPDLGTAVSFAAALVPMLYWGGMRPLHIFFLVAPLLSVVFSFEELWQDQAPVVFALFIIVSSVVVQLLLSRLWVTLTLLGINLSAGLVTTYLWANMLRGYQKARIMTFLDPERDALGSGWNIIQSRIAIGSGGPTGKGFLQGTQTKYEFLPAAHTDFIFSVIGEELGFLGAVFVLSLFLFVIWRSLYIGTIANNRYASLLAVGLGSMLAFHVFVNVGMTIGVMPVTGLPLPFLSYGGSSLLTNCLAVGLLLHIYAHRHEVLMLRACLLAGLAGFVVQNHCGVPGVTHEQLAVHFLERGQYEQALREATRAQREDPEDTQVPIIAALAHAGRGDIERAARTLAEALRAAPDEPRLYDALRSLCAEKGRHDLALEVLEGLAAERSGHWLLGLNLGWAHRAAGDSARAVELLRRAVTQADSSAPEAERALAHFELSRIYLQQGRADSAAAVLDSALTFAPRDPRLLIGAGESRLQLADTAAATARFEAALDAAEDVGSAASRIAMAWYNAGQRRRAIDYYERAIARRPAPLTLNNLAWTYAEAGIELERARELSLRAVKSDGDNVVYLDTYAEVLFRQGRAAKALALIERCLELEAPDGEQYGYLQEQRLRFAAALE